MKCNCRGSRQWWWWCHIWVSCMWPLYYSVITSSGVASWLQSGHSDRPALCAQWAGAPIVAPGAPIGPTRRVPTQSDSLSAIVDSWPSMKWIWDWRLHYQKSVLMMISGSMFEAISSSSWHLIVAINWFYIKLHQTINFNQPSCNIFLEPIAVQSY